MPQRPSSATFGESRCKNQLREEKEQPQRPPSQPQRPKLDALPSQAKENDARAPSPQRAKPTTPRDTPLRELFARRTSPPVQTREGGEAGAPLPALSLRPAPIPRPAAEAGAPPAAAASNSPPYRCSYRRASPPRRRSRKRHAATTAAVIAFESSRGWCAVEAACSSILDARRAAACPTLWRGRQPPDRAPSCRAPGVS